MLLSLHMEGACALQRSVRVCGASGNGQKQGI